MSEIILAPKEMSEKILRAPFGRTGLAVSPRIKNRSAVPRKALEIKKLERRRGISARLQVRHLLPRGKTKPVLFFEKQLPLVSAFAPVSTLGDHEHPCMNDPGLSLHCLPCWLQL